MKEGAGNDRRRQKFSGVLWLQRPVAQARISDLAYNISIRYPGPWPRCPFPSKGDNETASISSWLWTVGGVGAPWGLGHLLFGKLYTFLNSEVSLRAG